MPDATAPKLAQIQNDDELTKHLDRFVTATERAKAITAKANQKISAVKRKAAEDAAADEAQAGESAAMIEDYASRHRARLLPKGKKSTTIGPATLGWKNGRASVSVSKGVTEAQLVDELQAAGLGVCVVYADPVPSKSVILAMRDQVEAKGITGVAFKQDESFFVKAA